MRYIGAILGLSQIAVLVVALVLPGRSADAAGKAGIYKVFGVGAESCGQWTTYKSKDRLMYFAMSNWLEGFVSSANAYSWTGDNVASETDPKGMDAWVDTYCTTHPTNNFGTAAEALITFLSSGPHPSDK